MHFYLLLTLLFCAQIVPPSLKGVPAKGMRLESRISGCCGALHPYLRDSIGCGHDAGTMK